VTLFPAISQNRVDIDFHRKKNMLVLNLPHLAKILEKMKQSKSRKVDCLHDFSTE